jgi:glycosyltransferase involved in cell wall biosynthesis
LNKIVSEPFVSIGMPVYNGGEAVRPAIDALLAQTHRAFELIISDNASTDGTSEICREYAARDTRIRYSRNETNIGGVPNFERVLYLARHDYFMWAAHDDLWKPEFLEANLRPLLADRKVICSMCQALLAEHGGLVVPPIFNPAGTFPLMSSHVPSNLCKYLLLPGLNARFYGLWRRQVLLDNMPTGDFCSSDVSFVARTLMRGKIAEVKRRLWIRGSRGMSSDSLRLLRWGERNIVDRFVPLCRFTRDLLRFREVRESPVVLAALVILNCCFVREMSGNQRTSTFVTS